MRFYYIIHIIFSITTLIIVSVYVSNNRQHLRGASFDEMSYEPTYEPSNEVIEEYMEENDGYISE